MKKIIWIITIIIIVHAQLNAQDSRNQKPNFLFILVDDLSWADAGCYGNTFNETPNIDRLAEQGMRFTQAYSASPVCSPSRAAIQTGQYPARVGMNMIVNPHRRPWAKLTPPANRWNLPEDRQTLAEALKPAGYASTIIGKWNLGYQSPHLPEDEGYLFPPSQGLDELNEGYREAIINFAQQNPGKGIGGITQKAVKFMEERRDEPFLCFVSYHSVHIPMEARDELVQKYVDKKKQQQTDIHPKYAAMVEHTDESVGLLMQALDELELSENTVVVFFSDNGGLIQVYHQCGPIITSNKPLRGEKGNLYEGGIREPLIVRWPAKIKAGSVNDVAVIANDFFPTFMELAEVEAEQTIDGKSLVPLLTQKGNFKRETLYWHYPTYHHATPAAAVRDGDYKLIEFYETGDTELYNLKEDMGEQNNIASESPEIAQKLSNKLSDWQKSVNAAMPEPNPDYDISKAYIWGERPEKPWMEIAAQPLPMQEKCKLLDEDGEILN